MKTVDFIKILLCKISVVIAPSFRHMLYNSVIAMKNRTTLGSNPSVMVILSSMGWHSPVSAFLFNWRNHETLDFYAAKWVRLYEEKEDAGLVCRRCGISRPTLRKWYQRFQEFGIDGLRNQSRKPHSSPSQKITPKTEAIILDLRKSRKL